MYMLIVSCRPPVHAQSVDDLLNMCALRLIDWGCAIDTRHPRMPLRGVFVGRAHTNQFECPRMKDGRTWTVHVSVRSVHTAHRIDYRLDRPFWRVSDGTRDAFWAVHEHHTE
jgi:hypothetical protein